MKIGHLNLAENKQVNVVNHLQTATRISGKTCSTKKNFFGHVLGCGAGVLGESGSVNQCGTKVKVYGC